MASASLQGKALALNMEAHLGRDSGERACPLRPASRGVSFHRSPQAKARRGRRARRSQKPFRQCSCQSSEKNSPTFNFVLLTSNYSEPWPFYLTSRSGKELPELWE